MTRARGGVVLLVGFFALACFGRGRDDASGETGDVESNFLLRVCTVRCGEEGLTLEIDAIDAVAASVEFFVDGELAATFPLNQLDDTTWVAYPDWPSGYSFDDCGGSADFVCVIEDAEGEVIREAQ